MSVQKCILDMFIIQNCDIWVFNLKPSCQSLMNMSLGISINVYHTFKEICVAGYLMKGWFIFYSNCKIRHLLLWYTKFKASVTLYTFMLSVLWSNYELIQLNKCIPLFFFFFKWSKHREHFNNFTCKSIHHLFEPKDLSCWDL